MRVLVACEYSGRVRDAFIKRGHDAMSCDLLPTEQPGPHYQGDVRDILSERWGLLIAHPPCTYLSNAGAKHLFRGHELNEARYQEGLKAKAFFMLFIESDCERVCIENPIPSKIYEMPPYAQIVQPYYFGEPVQKKTCLWLKGLPALKPSCIVEPLSNCHDAGTWFMKGGKDRQKNRARTFQGIADAMAEQWG